MSDARTKVLIPTKVRTSTLIMTSALELLFVCIYHKALHWKYNCGPMSSIFRTKVTTIPVHILGFNVLLCTQVKHRYLFWHHCMIWVVGEVKLCISLIYFSKIQRISKPGVLCICYQTMSHSVLFENF